MPSPTKAQPREPKRPQRLRTVARPAARQAPAAKVPAARTPAPVAPAFLAAAAGILALLVGRFLLGIPTPAEVFGDRLTALIPLPAFARLLATFGTGAKHWYFASLVAGEGALTAAAGLAYWGARPWLLDRLRAGPARNGAPPPYTYREVPALVGWLWLLSALVLAPAIGGGLLGAGLPGGVFGVLRAQLLPDATFAVVFIARLRAAPPAPATRPMTAAARARRRVLRQGGLALAALAGGVVAWDIIASVVAGARTLSAPLRLGGDTPSRLVPPPVPTYGPWVPVAGQTPETTSIGQFYYVSKNLLGDPSIDQGAWSLSVTGVVASPYALTYDDLRALPVVERDHTLECISNEVGGDLMSTARFTGARLVDVLMRAGIGQGATEVIFSAADGYSDRLHLSQALDPRSLVVYLINGEPLPQAHGFPARLLIPGLYGMKNGKWLTGLQVDTGDYSGYWEQRGWTHEALVKMTTRIDVPGDGATLTTRPTTIAGVAYGGERGIARVEVSVDRGQTWRAANLKRPLGSLTWVLWELPWTPTAGMRTVAARAIDLEGNVQTPVIAATLPDGASGYHAVRVLVR